VHPNSRHSASECREIIKLVKRVSERHKQTSKDGSPPRRWPGKERVDDGDVAAGERNLGYQSPEGVLKYIFTGDFDSGDDNDRRKTLYMMYGGSWELTSRRNVKSLRREVLSVVPGVPKAAPHQRWSTTISFGASGCPENMAGAGILRLITAPVIANIKLHHVLIDGGAGLKSSAMLRSGSCRSQGPDWDPLVHSPEWALNWCITLGASCSWLHSGQRKTSAQRTSSSTLRRLTSRSMPSLAGRPCTGSWPLPITGIWSSRCRPQLGSSSCGATAPLRLRLWRSCTPWRQKLLARTTERGTLDLWYQGTYQGAKGAAIWSGRRPRQGHPAL
jgi:hypothetical protein